MTLASLISNEPLIIEPDEMGFAIALFVAAAHGRIQPPRHHNLAFTLSHSLGSSDTLLTGARMSLGENEDEVSDEVPLACAVAVLWHHYEQNPLQQAICSRLVAFYSLMARSKGALLAPWMTGIDTEPESMTLAPAIVEAVASAPLNGDGQFGDSDFLDCVRALSGTDTQLPETALLAKWKDRIRIEVDAKIPITEVVEQLSHHLFAFQSCVAAVHNSADGAQFRVIEQLCAKITEVSGNTGLQTMLSRALSATRADFPWLRSAKASKTGGLVGLDQVHPPPDSEEAMRGELAVLGSLIELLRSFLGDGVTLQLLRSLWPLASIDHG